MSNPRRDGEAQVRQACIKFLDDPPMSIPWQVEPECLDVLMKFVQRQRAEVWRECKLAHKEYKEARREVLRGGHIVPVPFGDYCETKATECEARARQSENDNTKT